MNDMGYFLYGFVAGYTISLIISVLAVEGIMLNNHGRK
jgi:hypothetical protein